jgi:hypothetical protein
VWNFDRGAAPENAVRRHEVVRALRAVLAGDDAAKRSTGTRTCGQRS